MRTFCWGHNPHTHTPPPKGSHQELQPGQSPAPGVSLYLEPPVVFGDGVGEVDALALGQELAQLRPLLHAQVIPHEIPVDAVPSPLFEVVEDAGSWEEPQRGAGWTWLCAGGSEPPKAAVGAVTQIMAARSGSCFCHGKDPSCLSLAGFETH